MPTVRPSAGTPAVLGLLAASLLGAGCASTPVDRTDHTMKSLERLAEGAAKSSTQVDRTLSAANGILESGESAPRKAFAKFSDELDNLTSARQRLGEDATGARLAADAYFHAWQLENLAIANPDIRARADERLAHARTQMDGVAPAMRSAESVLDPLLSDLRDTHRLLSLDLSPGGIAASADLVRRATTDAVGAKRALGELVATVARIRDALGVRRAQPGGGAAPAAK